MRLQGKIALVTGSSRGIGAAIARLFAAHGAKVALHGRDRDALAGVEREIHAAGGETRAFVADLTRYAEIEHMRQAIEHSLGHVDLLVANAGGSYEPPCAIEDASEEGWHASVEGNLTATFLTLKSFLPGMKRRGSGSVITVSSAAARRAHARNPIAYAAAKAGVEHLTKVAALQCGPSNVRVCCIAPETILTERNLERIPEGLRAELKESHPLQRLGTPEDVANAALFLASEESSWVTGVVLDIAGGAVIGR